MKPTMIDFFAGMGNFRAGFEQAGFQCVYSVEWDKDKRRIYEVIYGNEPNGVDIKQLRGIDLPDALVWCFGAPCQDFSLAGLRKGMDGDRSSLVREIFRLIRERSRAGRVLPKWLVYENVLGMLSSNNGWDFAAIVCEMGKLGYDVEWQVLNSKDFGVPQNRERVYTIGHFGKECKQKIFSHRGSIKKPRQLCRQYAGTITKQEPGVGRRGIYLTSKQLSHGRKLTPREYMRLQGVPDKSTDKLLAEGIPDRLLYEAAGDAVTVNVVYDVAIRIKETLKEE